MGHMQSLHHYVVCSQIIKTSVNRSSCTTRSFTMSNLVGRKYVCLRHKNAQNIKEVQHTSKKSCFIVLCFQLRHTCKKTLYESVAHNNLSTTPTPNRIREGNGGRLRWRREGKEKSFWGLFVSCFVPEFKLIFCHPCFYVIFACTYFLGEALWLTGLKAPTD